MARTLKQQIRKVIKEYSGNELAKYTRMAGGRKLMDVFVNALARAIKPGSVPPVDCACELIKFDGHPSPLDIELGRRIRSLRLQSAMSLQELAGRMRVHPDYLDELEHGKLTSGMGIYDTVARALGAPYLKKYLMQDMDEAAETEAWVRYAIAMYFGRSLWTFHPEVSYEESVGPFVRALVDLGRNEQHAATPLRPEPPIGYMVTVEEGKRKVVPDPDKAQKIREIFATYG